MFYANCCRVQQVDENEESKIRTPDANDLKSMYQPVDSGNDYEPMKDETDKQCAYQAVSTLNDINTDADDMDPYADTGGGNVFKVGGDCTVRRKLDAEAQKRQRLQQVLKEFCTEAVRGVNCQMLDAKTGRKMAATYSIDPDLTRITFDPEEHDGRNHIVDVDEIEDVCGHETASALLHQKVQKDLTPELLQRLIVVVLRDRQVAFLEQDALRRERFAMCAKLLRIRAQVLGPLAG